jgi:D-alanyl-D-alanine carboxypeptidase
MPHSSWITDRARRRVRRRVAATIGATLVAGAVLGVGQGAHADGWTPRPSERHHSFPAEPVMRKLTPEVRAQLDNAIRNVLRTTKAPGVTVGLWAPGNGSYVRAFGTADKTTNTPMSPGFNMRIGSVTKTFTVTALLRLVDQKQVSLEDPISRYVSGVPNGDHITLRHLAEMRSGLFNYLLDPDFGKDYLTDPRRVFTTAEMLAYSFKHGLGVFDVHGWIGHNGSLPGYQTVVVRLPAARTTLVVHTTSDIDFQGDALGTKFAQAVTSIVTPKNVYTLKPARPAHG